MPKPAYIICSASGSLDKYTNAISCFNIIEYLGIETIQPQPVVPEGEKPDKDGAFPVRVVAAWIRDRDATPDDVFESQFIFVYVPEQGEQVPLAFAKYEPVSFVEPIHRFVLPNVSLPVAPGSGELVIESRIRRLGGHDWSTQSFRVLIRESKAPPPQSAPLDSPSTVEA